MMIASATGSPTVVSAESTTEGCQGRPTSQPAEHSVGSNHPVRVTWSPPRSRTAALLGPTCAGGGSHAERNPRPGLVRSVVLGSEGAITGTVVSAAVIAASADYLHLTARLSLTIVGTAIVDWLAHLHASTLGSVLTHEHHPLAALRAKPPETAPILGAVGPLVAVLVGVDLFGGDLSTAAWTALWVSIALLVNLQLHRGVRGGLGRVGPLLERHPGRLYRPSRRAAQDPPALTAGLRRDRRDGASTD